MNPVLRQALLAMFEPRRFLAGEVPNVALTRRGKTRSQQSNNNDDDDDDNNSSNNINNNNNNNNNNTVNTDFQYASGPSARCCVGSGSPHPPHECRDLSFSFGGGVACLVPMDLVGNG